MYNVHGMCCMHLHHTLQVLHICTYINTYNIHTYAYYIIIMIIIIQQNDKQRYVCNSITIECPSCTH